MADKKNTMRNEPRKLMMDLAEKHLFYGHVDSMTKSRKPGEIIQKLPEDQRKILQELKSDDIVDVRWPLWK